MGIRVCNAIILLGLYSQITVAQLDLQRPFRACQLNGSITIFDLKNKKWLFSDSKDSEIQTLPASTFKIINALIALETGVIKNETQIVKWVNKVDTVLYGYRPEIYHDMMVKEAFEQSAGWVFIELAKKIGRKNYVHYLKKCGYGNGNLTEPDVDFWNFGAFGISPKNQVEFLIKLYNNQLPFAQKNVEIVKRLMLNEQSSDYTIRAKTGWTRYDNKDTGWWVGYVERNDNVFFFATRVIKSRAERNDKFGSCRKEITKNCLKQLNALP